MMKTKLVLIKTFWVMVGRAEGLSLFFPFDQFLADFFPRKNNQERSVCSVRVRSSSGVRLIVISAGTETESR